MALLTLTAAASIAAISGTLIVGASKLSDHYEEETAFERLRKALDLAVKDNPRVVKIQGRYWFFHKDDFNPSSRPGGVPVPKNKNGRFNEKRRVAFKPNDGWGSNSWDITKKFERKTNPRQLATKRYPNIRNEECAELFSEKYFQDGAMVKRKLRARDIIKEVA